MEGEEGTIIEQSFDDDVAGILAEDIHEPESQGEEPVQADPVDRSTVKIDGFEDATKIRREAEAQIQRYMQQEQELESRLRKFAETAGQWMNEAEPDWSELLENNPHEYLKKQEEYRKRSIALQSAAEARQKLNQQYEERQAEQLGAYISGERTKLVDELIPEWKSPKVRESEEQALIGYLKSTGYTDQDIQSLNYSRASNIAIARKAMLYDQAAAKARALKKPETEALMATPTATLSGKAQATNRSIADPNLSFDDFAKLRRAQIAKRR